jgi:hypothetical protein
MGSSGLRLVCYGKGKLFCQGTFDMTSQLLQFDGIFIQLIQFIYAPNYQIKK